MMKFIFILTVVFALQVKADVYAQTRMNLNLENVTIKQVIVQIRKNTDYSFVFSDEDLGGKILQSVRFDNATVDEVLRACLKGTDLTFDVVQKTIVIKKKSESQQQEVVTIHVKGKVVDKKGEPLPGVSIIPKGGFFGVTSDVNGIFSLSIPKEMQPILVFSFVGMKKQEVRIEGSAPLTVTLEENVAELSEVVVTGYQVMKKSNMVGATSSVKRDELFSDGTVSLEQMLQGKLPGMVIRNTTGLVGGRQKVRVRGTSTLLGNQEPVWVVDGIIQEDPLPFKTQELNTFGDVNSDNFDMVRNFVGNAISWLNPNDIEDITVLKDASATVLYGVKAANGVIVITTRKGQAWTHVGQLQRSCFHRFAHSLRQNEPDEFQGTYGCFPGNLRKRLIS